MKYLVEVLLPAAQKRFDMRIPADSQWGEITQLVAAIAEDLSGGSFRAAPQTVLCDAETGKFFDIDMTAAALGLRNGSQLILI